ncbi:extracellular solute-binding protein [Paenibacillus sp. YYML68]|uniref:extracellular solute-binding protein n=1 Tax=Paenibacillus sp. YYML68 TaxID=2909250 RepID=UPI0024928A8C|nr:extracellular solute-binding protein [Paenibacillus sp. YYML68]
MAWNPRRSYTTIVMMVMISLLSGLVAGCTGRPGESEATKDRPVISIMVPLHFAHPPNQRLIDTIEQKADVKLEIGWVPDGIYSDKMNTALTTNSMKKVTYVKYTDYMMLKNAIRSDSFWEIGPYLSQYPNLSKLNAEIMQQSTVDGKIYGLYTERPSSRQGIIIREDWLKRLKLDKPRTMDELYEVMAAFAQQDPDGNGKADTIGLVDRNDLVFGAFKTLGSYLGTPNNWIVQEGKLIPEFETTNYMDTMNFMRQLYKAKLINQDFAVTSKEIQRDKMIRGEAGVYIGSMLDVQRLNDEAKTFNPNAAFTLVNRIEGPEGHRVWSIPNYNALYLFSKKAIKTEEELKRILAFWDRTMDADVANLMRYGLEGVHYVAEGDKVVLPAETSRLRSSEVNALYPLMLADLSNPNVKSIARNEPLTELAEQLVKDNESFIVKDPVLGLESKTYDERSGELTKIISDATYNYILGNLDEQGFRGEIEKWKRSGGSQVIQEYSEKLFAR